jgi:hypothetical protein
MAGTCPKYRPLLGSQHCSRPGRVGSSRLGNATVGIPPPDARTLVGVAAAPARRLWPGDGGKADDGGVGTGGKGTSTVGAGKKKLSRASRARYWRSQPFRTIHSTAIAASAYGLASLASADHHPADGGDSNNANGDAVMF